RLTSMLILFLLYLGYIALANAFDNRERGARAAALLALVGVINVPIIKFSVDWWNTLHQPAGFITMSGSSLAGEFFWPLLYNLFAVMFVFGALLMAAMRADIQNRQYEAKLARLNRSGS
ncbi:MAG TPA: heme transporter HemC, partial [Hyphomonadaceae bacterium]|nr:heme transporter HemC [Hyphomonadaceae bacterium]